MTRTPILALALLALSACGSSSAPDGTTDPTVAAAATTTIPATLIPPVSIGAQTMTTDDMAYIADLNAKLYCAAADDVAWVTHSLWQDAITDADTMQATVHLMAEQCPTLVRDIRDLMQRMDG